MLPKAVRMLRRAEFVQASRTARFVATPCFVVQKVPDSAPNLSRRAKTANDKVANDKVANDQVAKNKTANDKPVPPYPSRLRTTATANPRLTLGITASRKVGKAVARNRAKRRLRALLYQMFFQDRTPAPARRIVLVARKSCLDADFATMRQQLEQALSRHKAQRP